MLLSVYLLFHLIIHKANSIECDFAPLTRLWNPHIVDHLYTTNTAERPTNWVVEGTEGSLSSTQCEGTVPLYRYWRNDVSYGQDHYYVNSQISAQDLITHRYTSEGIAGYCFPSQYPGTVPLYQYYNFHAPNGDHFYTINADEIGTTTPGQVGNAGYTFVRIECYVKAYKIGVRPNIHIDPYCTHAEYRGSQGYTANADDCKRRFRNAIQTNPRIDYAVWRGDADKSCHICDLKDRGANFADLKWSAIPKVVSFIKYEDCTALDDFRFIATGSCWNTRYEHPQYQDLSETDNKPATCAAACVREYGAQCAGFDTRGGCLIYRKNSDADQIITVRNCNNNDGTKQGASQACDYWTDGDCYAYEPSAHVSTHANEHIAPYCSHAEYRGWQGVTANAAECKKRFQNAINGNPSIDYAVWRGDVDNSCHICDLQGRGNMEDLQWSKLANAVSFIKYEQAACGEYNNAEAEMPRMIEGEAAVDAYTWTVPTYLAYLVIVLLLVNIICIAGTWCKRKQKHSKYNVVSMDTDTDTDIEHR